MCGYSVELSNVPTRIGLECPKSLTRIVLLVKGKVLEKRIRMTAELESKIVSLI